jgi:hypothetical protein
VISGYLDEVAALVRTGQRRGEIRRGTSARTLATHFLGIVQPQAMLWVLSGGSYDPRRPSREAWCLFENILRGTPARAPARGTSRRS